MESNLSGLDFSVLAVDLRFIIHIITLFPTSTIGIFSHILVKSLYHFGTFLYVILDVTSNIIMAAWAPMLGGLKIKIILVSFSETA